MNKIMQSEDIKKIDLNVLPLILNKLTLFNLSELYNHFNDTLQLSNKLISEVYKDSSRESKAQKIYIEKTYEQCMKNIKRSEIILYHIKNECNKRNIGQRFNITL